VRLHVGDEPPTGFIEALDGRAVGRPESETGWIARGVLRHMELEDQGPAGGEDDSSKRLVRRECPPNIMGDLLDERATAFEALEIVLRPRPCANDAETEMGDEADHKDPRRRRPEPPRPVESAPEVCGRKDEHEPGQQVEWQTYRRTLRFVEREDEDDPPRDTPHAGDPPPHKRREPPAPCGEPGDNHEDESGPRQSERGREEVAREAEIIETSVRARVGVDRPPRIGVAYVAEDLVRAARDDPGPEERQKDAAD